MQLGETIATYDVALALRGESGKFEVTSPAGEVFHLTCKPNQSIASFERSGSKAETQPFLIRKVAEPVSPQRGKTGPPEAGEGELQTRAAQAPFLLENQSNGTKETGDRVIALPKVLEENSGHDTVVNLDLVFVDRDAGTGKLSACVCVKRQSGQPDKNEGSLTSACATLNEFDAEVRRLHAELDEMRVRARKLFYKSQVVAASA